MTCPIYGKEHQLEFESADPTKTTFSCLCGAQIAEMEDAGTGA